MLAELSFPSVCELGALLPQLSQAVVHVLGQAEVVRQCDRIGGVDGRVPPPYGLARCMCGVCMHVRLGCVSVSVCLWGVNICAWIAVARVNGVVHGVSYAGIDIPSMLI